MWGGERQTGRPRKINSIAQVKRPELIGLRGDAHLSLIDHNKPGVGVVAKQHSHGELAMAYQVSRHHRPRYTFAGMP